MAKAKSKTNRELVMLVWIRIRLWWMSEGKHATLCMMSAMRENVWERQWIWTPDRIRTWIRTVTRGMHDIYDVNLRDIYSVNLSHIIYSYIIIWSIIISNVCHVKHDNTYCESMCDTTKLWLSLRCSLSTLPPPSLKILEWEFWIAVCCTLTTTLDKNS